MVLLQGRFAEIRLKQSIYICVAVAAIVVCGLRRLSELKMENEKVISMILTTLWVN